MCQADLLQRLNTKSVIRLPEVSPKATCSRASPFRDAAKFGLNLVQADKEESLRTFAANVETDRVTAKVTCFYKLCRSLRSGQDDPCGDSCFSC